MSEVSTEEQIEELSDFKKLIYVIIFRFFDTIFKFFNALFKSWVIAIFIIFYYTDKSIHDLAGKTTYARILIRQSYKLFIATTKTHIYYSFILLILLCIAFLIWALVENHIRRNYAEELGYIQKRYEQKSDPNRISSNITPRGYSNPED